MFFVVPVALLSSVYLVVSRCSSERRHSGSGASRHPGRISPLTPRGSGSRSVATAISAFVFRPQLAKLAIGPLARRSHDLPFAVKLLVGLVVFDFVSFTVHVAMHRIDALWNVHKVHHSTLELDGFATTRAHMLENLVRFVPGQALLYLVGMPVTVVTTTVATYAIWGVSNQATSASTFDGPSRSWLPPDCIAGTTFPRRLRKLRHVPHHLGSGIRQFAVRDTTDGSASVFRVRSTRIRRSSPRPFVSHCSTCAAGSQRLHEPRLLPAPRW